MASTEDTQAKVKAFAPMLAELVKDPLYTRIWSRTGELSARERSLVTIAALVALQAHPMLETHLKTGVKNGLRREEIAETITHLAFYAGFPAALTAAALVSTSCKRAAPQRVSNETNTRTGG